MPSCKRGRSIAAAVGLLVGVSSAADADACGDEAVIAGVAALGFVAPADIGVAVATSAPSTPGVVLGWSWQIPLGGESAFGAPSRHRLVPGFDLVLRADGPSWRGRFGYRYARRHVVAGAGIGFDATGVSLSPEIGVKFAHADATDAIADLSLHVLARPDVALDSGRVRGASFLFGWNFL